MTLPSIETRMNEVAAIARHLVPADGTVTPEAPNRIVIARADSKDYLLQFTDVDRLIEVSIPAAGQRIGFLEPMTVLTTIRRFYETPDSIPGMFTCRECGDYDAPIDPSDDVSLCCVCGARLDVQRAALAAEARTSWPS